MVEANFWPMLMLDLLASINDKKVEEEGRIWVGKKIKLNET